MSFLAPSVLWGLLAASAPIIIHLVSTRRTQTVNFSTVRFIKALEHDTIKKLKLRQWLLVLLRTLAVVLLVLVFSRPVKTGYFPSWAVGDRSTRMGFLLDNSGSMGAIYEGVSLLKRSKSIVLKTLQRVEGKLSADIYQTTPFKRRFSGEFQSVEQIRDILSEIHETSGRDHLWQAVEELLNQSMIETRGTGAIANEEFFILSDFPATAPGHWEPESPTNYEVSSAQRFYLFPQPEIEGNLSVLSADVQSQLRLLGQLVSVEATIGNHARALRKNVPIQLYFDGNRVGQVVSDLPASESKDFVFQAFPNRTGSIRGVVEIPEDGFELDNRRFFQFSIPPRIRCKVLGPSQEHLTLLRVALTSISQDSLFVEFEEQDPYEVGTVSLEKTDVLILIDPADFSPAIAKEIAAFAKQGGSIMAFLGERYSNSFDGTVVEGLSLPNSRGMTVLAEGSFHEVTKYDAKHPLFRNFQAINLSREMPRIFKHVKIADGGEGKVIMSISNNEPLLMEIRTPYSKVLAFAALPNPEWTDLPLRGFFVPLLHRILVYLAASESEGRSVEVGETVNIPLQRQFISGQLEIVGPTGRRTKLVPDYVGELVTVDEVDEAGLYRLLSNGEEVSSFVANVSPAENPAKRLTEEELLSFFPSDRTRLVRSDENAPAAVIAARWGTELWRLFLVAALAVLSAETWVGRVKGERSRS
ncbi:MAG: BatA domain-containing protein [Candidatus Neomarinimicrobiota bacterium]